MRLISAILTVMLLLSSYSFSVDARMRFPKSFENIDMRKKSLQVVNDFKEEIIKLYLDAEIGNIESQARLAQIYGFGEIDQEYFIPEKEVALKWWNKAIESGLHCDRASIYYQGFLYYEMKDYKNAFNRFNLAGTMIPELREDESEEHKSSEEGVKTQAEYSLGFMYIHGQGVSKDIDKGMALLLSAVDKGSVDAAITLGDIYRDDAYERVDYEKSFELYHKVNDYLKKDDLDIVYYLASCYLEGKGVKKDEVKGLEMLTEAAERGQIDSQNDLAEHYFNLNKYEKALYWAKKVPSDPNAKTLSKARSVVLSFYNLICYDWKSYNTSMDDDNILSIYRSKVVVKIGKKIYPLKTEIEYEIKENFLIYSIFISHNKEPLLKIYFNLNDDKSFDTMIAKFETELKMTINYKKVPERYPVNDAQLIEECRMYLSAIEGDAYYELYKDLYLDYAKMTPKEFNLFVFDMNTEYGYFGAFRKRLKDNILKEERRLGIKR